MRNYKTVHNYVDYFHYIILKERKHPRKLSCMTEMTIQLFDLGLCFRINESLQSSNKYP